MSLTYVRTINGSFSPLNIHANFAMAPNGYRIHVVDNNNIRAFGIGRSQGTYTFSRSSPNDVSLSGHPSSIGTWGFTTTNFDEESPSTWDWVILTRERNVSEGTIGKVRVYSHDGSENKLEFDVPGTVAGLDTVAMRAPKSVSVLYGHYIVRVVRGVAGNMRFLVFNSQGVIQPDLTITLESATPSALRDATSGDNTPLYVYNRGTPNGAIYAIDPSDGSEITDESVSSPDFPTSDGISVVTYDDGQPLNPGPGIFVADGSFVHEWSGVPEIANPFAAAEGGGSAGAINPGLFQMLVTDGIMSRSMNRRRNRR